MRKTLFISLLAATITVFAFGAVASAAQVNVCPVNGNSGIFLATGPITVSDRVMSTPAFGGNPAGGPSEGPFWPVN